MEGLWRDLRESTLSILRRPAFALMAAGTLALGIGANAAGFALVRGVLLRPLPYLEPERLVKLWETNAARGGGEEMTSLSNIEDWRAGNRSLTEIAAWRRPTSLAMTSETPAVELRAGIVTDNFFRVLGVAPARGRSFADGEGRTASARIAVVSHGLWQRHLGGAERAVGATLQLEERDFIVVGIMPAGFKSPAGDADVWLPMPEDVNEIDRGQTYLQAIARLRPSVGLEQAQADLDAVASRLASAYPASNRGRGIRVASLTQETVGRARRPLWVVLGAMALVWSIAVANVANLLLLRAVERRHDIALRAALGASAGRLARRLAIEATLLASLAGVAGLAVAAAALAALKAAGPGQLPRLDEVRIDAAAVLFGLGLSLLTAALLALVPAWMAARSVHAIDLHQAGRRIASPGPGGARLRSALAVGQVALTLMLLVSAGLLTRSLARLLAVDPGFRTAGVLVARISLGRDYQQDDREVAYFRELTARLRALPGVSAAGAATVLPLNPYGIDFSVPFHRPGEPEPERATAPKARFRSATPEYFDAIGMALLRGRSFTAADRRDAARVVVVNEALADQAWPGGNPVGERLRFFWSDWQTYEVVGLVASARSDALAAPVTPELFVPHAQVPYTIMNVVVSASRRATGLADAVRRRVLEMDPQEPVHSIATMDELIADSTARERFTLSWLGAIAAAALILATVGVYSVASFVASLRLREIGVRIAVGASRADIGRLLLGSGSAIAIAGIALGLLGSLALGRVLSGLLFELTPTDPQTLAAVVALLLAVTLAASWIPARRAMRVDPISVLREG